MAKFKVEWKSGKVLEIESSDCETVEQFKNSYFGRGVAVEAEVSKVGEEVAAEPKKPAKKPAKKAASE